MGFQPSGGVKEFLALDDVLDSSYTGKAGQIPKVNSAETALQLGAGFITPAQPVYDDTVIYEANAPVAWQELDVGVANALVYIEIDRQANAAADLYRFRRTSDTLLPCAINVISINSVNFTLGYALVLTDSAGKVWWYCSAARWTKLTRIAYWIVPVVDTVLLSGAAPAAGWYDLNCGVANSLVLLRMLSTEAGNIQSGFRKRGETYDCDWTTGVMANRISDLGPTSQGYAIMQTDSQGYCQWKSPWLNANYEIKLCAYIYGMTPLERVIYSGLKDSTWADLDSEITGRCYAFMRIRMTVGALGQAHKFREKGIALVPYFGNPIAVTGMSNLNQIGYVFAPFDENDIIEHEGDDANWEVKIEAISR